MDSLDYAEKIADATLEEARAAYDLAHERIYKFLTLLVGGAGATGVYALGKIGVPGGLTQLLPLLFVSVWLFGIAAFLLIRGARSNQMKAGSDGAAILGRFEEEAQAAQGENVSDQAMSATRRAQLLAVDLQIASYSEAASLRSKALDTAYHWAVASPLPALYGYVFAIALR